MKNVISVALLSLSVICSTLVCLGQNPESPKSKSTVLSANAALDRTRSSPDKTSSPEDPVVEAQKYYDSGMAHSEAGRLDEAIEAFKQSLKIRPEEAQTHFSLGMTYSKSKAYKDAFESFKKAARYKPEWPEAHFRLGVMSYVLGKKSQSTEEYKRLLQVNSPLANILYRIIKDDSAPSTVAQNVSATDPLEVAPLTESRSSENSQSGSGTDQSTPAHVTSANGSANGPVSDNSANTSSATTPSTTEPLATSAAAKLTEIYRVGLGDILDIRFLNTASAGRSTLFTVVGGGVIDLPVAGGPIAVVGLTTDEIQSRVASELKRRAVADNAQISVGVREYVSHSVVINGLVASPGTRILRREAVPLYVILAESHLRNDAGRVVIMRAGATGQVLDLSDSVALNTNVVNGDVITVTGRPQEFYYIGGKVNYPGQKNFQAGISLLQAILAAGGTRQSESIVEISREGADGRLVTTRFNLKSIKSGEIGDPKVQPGDRIEVLK